MTPTAPTWGDVEDFLGADGWRQVEKGGRGGSRSRHVFYEKTLDDDHVLQTHVSHPRQKTLSPGRFSSVLRHQLEVSREQFWECIRTRRPVDRPVELEAGPVEHEPWVVAVLVGELHMTTVDRMDDGFVIETSGLTKRYGERILAVDRLDLRVRRGEVYGFLGPNGAGKTTTLRMLLGLVRPTSGSALVLGAAPGSPEGLVRVGALVESPSLYPFLSGRDNLRVLARHARAPESRVDAVLEEVELADRASDRFATYSLGMKQRLGVAAALLKDPELLILDEPTNGLDPAGMAEMRTFIRGLGRDRRTVLLSSHLMTEVEQICDRVGVIRGGSLVGEGTVAELRGRETLRVRAAPVAAAERLLATLPTVERVTVAGEDLHVTRPASSRSRRSCPAAGTSPRETLRLSLGVRVELQDQRLRPLEERPLL